MSLTPITPSVGQPDVVAWGMKAMSHNYVQRVLCGLDQFLNVLTYGNLDETMSARSSRYFRNYQTKAWVGWQKFGAFMCWWLDKLQSLHGLKAEAGDLARAMKIVNLERADLGLPPVNLLS
jgi:hypothetical protein